MPAQFDLQTYLTDMEGRLREDLQGIRADLKDTNERLEVLPALDERVKVLEKSRSATAKGMWTLFVSFVGAVLAYVLRQH